MTHEEIRPGVQRRTLLQGLTASAALAACKPSRRADVGGVVVDDVSRLNDTRVRRVVPCASVDDVKAAIAAARAEGLPVIASGRRHSQGGQCSVDDGVVLDLTPLKQHIAVHVGTAGDAADEDTVTVDAGASWDDVQRALNPHGLAVRTMQSSNIFTVGGSLASNIHGRDVNDSVILSSVRSLTVVDADGTVTERDRRDPLVPYIVSGLGLFGVVTRATLAVTKNRVMRHAARIIKTTTLPQHFQDTIAGTDCLFIARPSIVPKTLFGECIVETWTAAPDVAVTPALSPLGAEEHVQRDKLVFDASRRSAAGKEARWELQKQVALAGTALVTRNNAMRPPTTPLAFLDHTDEKDTDIVQEYFVPVAGFGDFLAAATAILRRQQVNVLGLTIRFVKGNADAALSFAPTDSFAFMLYTNQKRSKPGVDAAIRMTEELVAAVHAVGGRHYLTYQSWAPPPLVHQVWPALAGVFAKKRAVDPHGVFRNRFFDRYALPA